MTPTDIVVYGVVPFSVATCIAGVAARCGPERRPLGLAIALNLAVITLYAVSEARSLWLMNGISPSHKDLEWGAAIQGIALHACFPREAKDWLVWVSVLGLIATWFGWARDSVRSLPLGEPDGRSLTEEQTLESRVSPHLEIASGRDRRSIGWRNGLADGLVWASITAILFFGLLRDSVYLTRTWGVLEASLRIGGIALAVGGAAGIRRANRAPCEAYRWIRQGTLTWVSFVLSVTVILSGSLALGLLAGGIASSVLGVWVGRRVGRYRANQRVGVPQAAEGDSDRLELVNSWLLLSLFVVVSSSLFAGMASLPAWLFGFALWGTVLAPSRRRIGVVLCVASIAVSSGGLVVALLRFLSQLNSGYGYT